MEETMSWNHKNILKIKSDPLREVDIDAGESAERQHEEVDTGRDTLENLQKEIEPWLTALFQSEHLSLLVGTGITSAIHIMAQGIAPQGMSLMEYSVFREQIDKGTKESAEKTGRGEPNIEDQIRVANELIRGMEIYLSAHPYGVKKLTRELEKFKKELEAGLAEFTNNVLSTERNIVTSDNLESTIEYLSGFLVSFCSRTATRERLNLFTTNYDRLLEFGAELAGVRLLDRFIGTLNPVFRASRMEVDMHYNPPGIRGEPRYLEGVVHYTKLHGSLDWVSQGSGIRKFALPFGTDRDIRDYFPRTSDSGAVSQLLIYPNPSKDRETSEYPYVELFRDMAAAICRPNATLVTYGYGFGDDHINRIIRDMLTIPSTHLVIITYTDEGGRVKRFYESVGRPAQVTILAGKHFGDLKNLVDYYLPKPAIDRATNRMADILKSRGWINPTAQSGEGNA